MEKKKKQLYQAPELTVVAFKAEQGYLVSSATLNLPLFEYESSNPNVTQYNQSDSWAGYDWDD